MRDRLIDSIIDIEWWFFSSASALGIQSNFSAIRNALLNGGVSRTSCPDNMSDSRIQAAERYRIIYNRIKKMSNNGQDILHACYHDRQWLPHSWSTYGRRLGATPFTKTGNYEFDRDCKYKDDDSFWAWLEGSIIRGETWRSDKIKREAEQLLEDAYKEYSEL